MAASGDDLFLSTPHPPSSFIPRRRAVLSTANIRPFDLTRPNILAVFGLTRPNTPRMSSSAPIFGPVYKYGVHCPSSTFQIKPSTLSLSLSLLSAYSPSHFSALLIPSRVLVSRGSNGYVRTPPCHGSAGGRLLRGCLSLLHAPQNPKPIAGICAGSGA